MSQGRGGAALRDRAVVNRNPVALRKRGKIVIRKFSLGGRRTQEDGRRATPRDCRESAHNESPRDSPIWRAKLFALLSLVFCGMAYAQSAPQPHASKSANESLIEFSFAGLMWHMPKPFFQGIRPFSENTENLLIDFVWEQQNDTFFPVGAHVGGMRLGVDIRTLPIGDPKGGALLAQRFNKALEKLPIFAAGKFLGMTYVGSSSNIHFFTLNHVDAYVSCMLMISDRLPRGKVAPDVLSKKFSCDTLFRLPRSTYARVTSSWVDLNDVGPAFTSVYRETISFIY
jgi:hypothetical protein